MDRVLMEYEEMLVKEIENMIDKGELNTSDVKNIGCAIDILKDMYTIEAMKGEISYSGSNNSYYDGGNSNRSYDNYGRNSGRSYARDNMDFYREDRLRRDMNNGRIR